MIEELITDFKHLLYLIVFTFKWFLYELSEKFGLGCSGMEGGGFFEKTTYLGEISRNFSFYKYNSI